MSSLYKKFDITSMPYNVTIAIIGKIGKSYLTNNILFHKKYISSIAVISKTKKFYADFIPDSFIYDEYNNTILNRLYEKQLNISKDNEKKVARPMLIIDDCMKSKGSWVEEPISDLTLNSRHYNLSFILTTQLPQSIPPEMRSNFDYIFLLADNSLLNRKFLYNHYAEMDDFMFPDFNTFEKVFLNLTENYGCMVINNHKISKDITEKIFWYKAIDTPNFTIGIE